MITGSGNTAIAQDAKLALYLANLTVEYVEATRRIDTFVAKAALDGAVRSANLLGYDARGTENAIFSDVLDWVRANPRNAGVATPAMKVWHAKVRTELAAILADHRRSA